MKAFLVLSQLFCLAALYQSSVRKLYPLLLGCLALAIPAALLFSLDESWLRSWYLILAAPVALFRLLAALEVSHRQTEGFLGWPWLMPAVWFSAAVLTGACFWAAKYGGPGLPEFVDLRRLSQIWQAWVFVLLEVWWIWQAGLWRQRDWTAAGFALSSINHGAVSFAAVAWGWSETTWPRTFVLSWAIEAAAYLILTVIFLWPEAFQKRLVETLGFLYGIRRRLLRSATFGL